MIRGGVYPVDLGDAKRGHEQRGRRLGIVVSISQDHWSTVTIVPTSTSARPASFRPRLTIQGRETCALTDRIRTIDTQYVLGGPYDHLDSVAMGQVEYALVRYLGLDASLILWGS